jgi:uncharacterized membrane protein
MSLNLAHFHLLLNHFPIIGMIIGFGLFLVSFFEKNEDLRRASYIIFAAVALLTIPTFLTCVGAQVMLSGQPNVSDALIQRHEGSAFLALWFIEITGALAIVGLWQEHERSHPANWNILAVLLFALLTLVLVARTGNTGGEIGHPEVRGWNGTTITEGTFGSIISKFEPAPDKLSSFIINDEKFWAFLMVTHFIGLALIVGTVGILDIRIMGFFRELPVAPLHRFLPWALVGLAINIVTGMVAFMGQPQSYITSEAFWLKIVALLLLGVNAVAFYLTGIFGRIERLQAGEDAPISAKLVAASGLFLWFAVITFGRYIQTLTGSIHFGPN